jgi:hypothetical protein
LLESGLGQAGIKSISNGNLLLPTLSCLQDSRSRARDELRDEKPDQALLQDFQPAVLSLAPEVLASVNVDWPDLPRRPLGRPS